MFVELIYFVLNLLLSVLFGVFSVFIFEEYKWNKRSTVLLDKVCKKVNYYVTEEVDKMKRVCARLEEQVVAGLRPRTTGSMSEMYNKC